MEVMLRCAVPDRPGALSELAGAIGRAGGDIQAVDVVEVADGRALDDLVVFVTEPGVLRALLEEIERLDGIDLVHTGPSRGHPSDLATRMAITFEHVLNGAMALEHALSALVGGMLRAGAVRLVDASDAPAPHATQLVLPLDDRAVVVNRDYRFTDGERERGRAVVRAVAEAARTTTPT